MVIIMTQEDKKISFFFNALSKQREDLREEYVHDSLKLSDWQHLMKKDDELNMYNQYHVNNSMHGLIMLLHEQISKQQRMIEMLVETSQESVRSDDESIDKRFVTVRESPRDRLVFSCRQSCTLDSLISSVPKFLMRLNKGDALTLTQTPSFLPSAYLYKGADPYDKENYVSVPMGSL